MALNFPVSPTANQIFTDSTTGNRYLWDAVNQVWKWSPNTISMTVSSIPPGSPTTGTLWFDTDPGDLYVYYNNTWSEAAYSANTTAIAAYKQANAAFDKANTGAFTPLNVSSQIFVANGAQTAFFLGNNSPQQNNAIVSVDGLTQIPGIHYTIAGSTLTFTTEPLNKSNVEIRIFPVKTTYTIVGTTNNGNITVYLSDIYTHANLVGFSANTYTDSKSLGIGAGANAYANLVWSRSNAFTSATIAGANTAVGAGANAYANLVWSRSNSFTSITIAGANTAVGAGANAYANVVWSRSNTYTQVAFDKANTVETTAIAAFNKANTAASTGKAIAMAIVFG